MIGSKIGDKYVVESLLGQGGMSRVYKAVQYGVDRRVAIKVLREELAASKLSKRMEREARSISELSHPNLVSIFDTGSLDNGLPYHVLEYLDGISLADEIDINGALSPKRAIPIFIQICDVMQYAHERGLIDRDLSPSNIMLVKAAGMDDFVKLVDFGVMKYDEDMHVVSQRLTATGEVCGNPMYMSPEQASGDEIDARTDIYSFGAVMWETLTGRPMFEGRSIAEIITKHLYTAPTKPSLVNSNISVALEDIVLKALEKQVANRFQSMADLKSALSDVIRRSRTAENRLPAFYGKGVTANKGSAHDAGQNVRVQESSALAIPTANNTVRDLAIAFIVAVCAAACICLLMVQFIKVR